MASKQSKAKLQRFIEIYNNLRSGALLAWGIGLPTMFTTSIETGMIAYLIAVGGIALLKRACITSFRQLGWVK